MPPRTRITEQLERSAANAAKKKTPSKKGTGNPAPAQLEKYLFKPGQLTPPRTSVVARNALQGKFLTALHDDFAKHGVRAIERARIQDPMGFVKAIVALMPKQFEAASPLQDLSDSELERGIEYLKSRLAVSDGAGIRAPPLLIETDGLQAIPETS